MTSARFAIGVAVVALLAPGGMRAQAPGFSQRPDILIRYRAGISESRRAAVRARLGARLHGHFAHVGVDALRLPAGADAAAVSRALASDPAVLYAQPNYTRSIVASPNDPAFANDMVWGLKRIAAPEAWSAFSPDARDIVVAVIDTGINYRHPDLASNSWVNPGEIAGNGLDDDGNGYVDDVHGIDTINGDADPLDDNGHGTHTAGIVGAEGNNGIGASGVAWHPQIVACKALDSSGNGSDHAAIACFDYLIDLKLRRGVNVRISNNSWGSVRNATLPFPQALKDAVDAAGAAGIVHVFAAGNTTSNTDSAAFDPASFDSPSIVSVAASDSSDGPATFSNYGPVSVDLAAPGVDIFSTYRDGYAYSSGTSMAAPHVAGTLALMAAQNRSLTVDGIRTRLLASVDTVAAWTGLTVTAGRLNVLRAVLGSTEAPPAPELDAAGWTHDDVGQTGAAGGAGLANGVFTVTGAGADVWGTADAFHYVYRPLQGDGSIVARVSAIQNVNNWTKAGVMIRNSTAPASAQAFMLVAASPLKGTPFQRRVADGGVSVSTPGSQSTAPRWVKLTRTGGTISAYESADGVAWTLVGSETFTMGETVLAGLAVSSHVSGVTATATFDDVTLSPAAPPSVASSLPAGWTHSDVGAVPVPGDAVASAGAIGITGSGADVWGTSDAFHYAFTAVGGDATIVARVTAVQGGVHAWVKAGVMIRRSLDAGSPHAFMLVSAGKGVAFQRRAAVNDLTTSSTGSFSVAPRWVKLQRAGDVFSAYESADGLSWTLAGTETIAMGSRVFVGLAVTSHASVAATCAFDSLSIY